MLRVCVRVVTANGILWCVRLSAEARARYEMCRLFVHSFPAFLGTLLKPTVTALVLKLLFGKAEMTSLRQK